MKEEDNNINISEDNDINIGKDNNKIVNKDNNFNSQTHMILKLQNRFEQFKIYEDIFSFLSIKKIKSLHCVLLKEKYLKHDKCWILIIRFIF